jgi:uncharacterized protein YndB with AHSA1/START domain
MSNQSQAPIEITVSHRYDAAPERVFDAWLDEAHAGGWLFATPGGVMTKVAIDGRVGGGFTIIERRGEVDAAHIGTYTSLDRPNRIEFRFSTSREEAGTPVSVAIAPVNDGTELTLTQALAPEWADFAEQGKRSWEMMLTSLERVLSN